MKRVALLTVCLTAILLVVAGCPKKTPTVPITPLGNDTSWDHATETYRTVSSDPGKNQIKYVFDWGDGSYDTTDLYDGDGTDTASAVHTWLTTGSFPVTAMAINAKGAKSGWSSALTVRVGSNNAPNAPDAIQGVHGGILNQPITFTTKSTDPDGDSVYIKFVFDTTQANKNSGWLGPVAGGTYVSDSTEYTKAGTYYVVAYAKDTKGAISLPSPVFPVTIGALSISWSYNDADGNAFYSSPAIDVNSGAGDTIVYCGDEDTEFFAFNARTGAIKGTFASLNEGSFSSSPAISADGQRVYIADDDEWLYCLSASGLNDLSHYPTSNSPVPGQQPFFSTPAVYSNNIYIGRDDGALYQFIDNAGQLNYQRNYDTHADISSSPAISSDGTRIVVGNDSGYIYCFDDTLTLVWKTPLPAPTSSSPAIDGNTVYVGCDDQNLYALSLTDGSIIGTPFPAGDFITSSPVVDAAHNVYFDVDKGTVYCVNNGVQVWSEDLPYGENTTGTCCLAPDTTLIINTDDGSVYGLSLATGAPVWRIEWPQPVFATHSRNVNRSRNAKTGRKTTTLTSSVTIGPGNGMFYAGSTNEGFYAVTVGTPSFKGPLPTPWPKFHHDIANSGLVGRIQ